MNIHKRAAVVAAVAFALGASSAAVAGAAPSPTGAAKSAAGKAGAAAHKAAAKVKPKPPKVAFVHAGKVTAVSPTSITFTVQGGPNKALRGRPLTVVITPTTKVTRGIAAATIASVLVGDHVNVKGTKAGSVYTATRVSAAPAAG